jgi:hypothetical protein
MEKKSEQVILFDAMIPYSLFFYELHVFVKN